MTDIHKHIADVLIALEGLEYGLFDDAGFLQACSSGLVDFVFDCQDSHVQGEHITSLFPEMIGVEGYVIGDLWARGKPSEATFHHSLYEKRCAVEFST